MAKGTSSDELKQAFQDHLQETEGHIERLDEMFEELFLTCRYGAFETAAGNSEFSSDKLHLIPFSHWRKGEGENQKFRGVTNPRLIAF